MAQSYKRTWIYKEFNLYGLIKVFVPRDLAPLIIQSYSSDHFNSLISKIRINHKTNLVKFHLKRFFVQECTYLERSIAPVHTPGST